MFLLPIYYPIVAYSRHNILLVYSSARVSVCLSRCSVLLRFSYLHNAHPTLLLVSHYAVRMANLFLFSSDARKLFSSDARKLFSSDAIKLFSSSLVYPCAIGRIVAVSYMLANIQMALFDIIFGCFNLAGVHGS